MEPDDTLTSYMLTDMIFDTAIRDEDGIIIGWDATKGAALIDAYAAKARQHGWNEAIEAAKGLASTGGGNGALVAAIQALKLPTQEKEGK